MFSDFCFSNGSIVSYEPKHYDSDFFGYYYNIFRKTTIYNKNNMIITQDTQNTNTTNNYIYQIKFDNLFQFDFSSFLIEQFFHYFFLH